MSDESYRDKLRSVSFGRRHGTTETRVVTRDDNGKPAGYQVQHWDGRVDAVVTPSRLALKSKQVEE
jgi:hypothetical protein